MDIKKVLITSEDLLRSEISNFHFKTLTKCVEAYCSSVKLGDKSVNELLVIVIFQVYLHTVTMYYQVIM